MQFKLEKDNGDIWIRLYENGEEVYQRLVSAEYVDIFAIKETINMYETGNLAFTLQEELARIGEVPSL